jgi:hypothetical protein
MARRAGGSAREIESAFRPADFGSAATGARGEMKISQSSSSSSSSSKKEIKSRTRTTTTRNHFARLVGFFSILLAAFGVTAQMTNTLSDAEIQGRQLTQKLLDQQPPENFTNTGVLKIRDSKGITTNLPVKFEIVITQTNWQNIYTASFEYYDTSNSFGWRGEVITVSHFDHQINQYKKMVGFSYGSKWKDGSPSNIGPNGADTETLSGDKTMVPFANSDFWIADLGLEFFHWPEQKILKKEFSRGRGCMVLESTNPNPSTNGYSRVDCWIDEESGGIVHAEAFDAQNKLLKVFDPKSFKKVNGQWELQDMEIRNMQTGSRTRIEFNLGATNLPQK